MPGKPAIFLDRDGVINRSIIRNGNPYPPSNLEEFELLPGAIVSLRKLVDAGYLLIGITNQPDVARGTQSREIVEAINSLIKTQLPIVAIYTCYHDNKDNCSCRKPKPGLIFQGAFEYNINLSRSWMVGDRWKDISAGHAAGLRTVFVDYHYNEPFKGQLPEFIIEDMAALSGIVLNS